MSISLSIRLEVERRARARCEYCGFPDALMGLPAPLDHVVPVALGGESSIENLALSCPSCNCYKADATQAADPQTKLVAPLYNPRRESWSGHFRMGVDGRIDGQTPSGRATVERLRLNHVRQLRVRQRLLARGWWAIPGSAGAPPA